MKLESVSPLSFFSLTETRELSPWWHLWEWPRHYWVVAGERVIRGGKQAEELIPAEVGLVTLVPSPAETGDSGVHNPVTCVHNLMIPGSLGLSGHAFLNPPQLRMIWFPLIFSVKIRFKLILFRELEESFMALLKIPLRLSLGCHQSKAIMVERNTE